MNPYSIIGRYPIAFGVGAAAVLGALAFAVYKIYGFVKDPNAGTDYAGNGSILTVPGAVATLGNVTNQVLGGVPATVGEALGSGVYQLFNPDLGSSTTYIFTLPDGSKGAVDSSQLDGAGNFVYSGGDTAFKGKHLQLLSKQDGSHYAVSP